VSLAVRRGQLRLLSDHLDEIVRLLSESREEGAGPWLDKFGAPCRACKKLLNSGFTQDDLDIVSGEVMDLMDDRRGGEMPFLGRNVSEQIGPYLRPLRELALQLRVIGYLSTEESAW